MRELVPIDQLSDVPEWLQHYRQPMDGSRQWFHGADCAALPLSAGAAEKYDTNGKVLPLPGFSIVTFLDPSSAAYHNLTELSAELRSAYKTKGINNTFAFLPPDTYHVTIADILVRPSDVQAQDIIEATNKSFEQLLNERLPPLEFRLRSDVVVSAGVSVVALAEPKTKQDLDIVHHARDVLGANLRVVGIEMNPADKFIGHVSVAYFCGGMNPADYSKFKEVARAYDTTRGLLGDVAVRSMELRNFEDMENWGMGPILSLVLGNHLPANAVSQEISV